MTIEEALQSAEIERLDAEVLLAYMLKKDRSWIAAHADQKIDIDTWSDLQARRKRNEPVAYITNTKEFYGRDFYVDARVLIPRPSTEGLVDLTRDILKNPHNEVRELDTQVIGVAMVDDVSDIEYIVDIGTGSGCIAITLALETNYSIIATDISSDALDVAKKNAATYSVEDRISFKHGKGPLPLEGLQSPFLVVSNPPYIPEDEKLAPDVSHYEPNEALFSGKDGAQTVVNLNNSLREHPYCRGRIFECRDTHRDLLM